MCELVGVVRHARLLAARQLRHGHRVLQVLLLLAHGRQVRYQKVVQAALAAVPLPLLLLAAETLALARLSLSGVVAG